MDRAEGVDITVVVLAMEDLLQATFVVESSLAVVVGLEEPAVVHRLQKDLAAAHFFDAPMAVRTIHRGETDVVLVGLEKVAVVRAQAHMVPAMQNVVHNVPMSVRSMHMTELDGHFFAFV
jgi:hypothetical protein